MKRITVLISFFVLFFTAGRAQEVVLNVTHVTTVTAGTFAAEVAAALTDAGLTADQVERLVVTGGAGIWFNGADCKALATTFTTATLKVVDLSGVAFYQDAIPDNAGTTGAFSNLLVEEIIIPSTITQIRRRGFLNCPNLKKVVLPAGLQQIRAYAFMNCPNLIDLGGELPSGITTIGINAFQNSTNLALNTLPSGLIQAMDINSAVVAATLANTAFSGTKVAFNSIPAGITKIGNNTFTNTLITSMSFAAGTTNIGNSAFSGTPIATLIFNGNAPVLGTTPFGTTAASDIELCKPSGATGFDVSPWSDMKACVSTALQPGNESSVNLLSSMVTDLLRVGNVGQDTEATIYNTNGKLVHAVKLHANQEEQTISVVNLPKGFYYLKTNQSTFKFIKN